MVNESRFLYFVTSLDGFIIISNTEYISLPIELFNLPLGKNIVFFDGIERRYNKELTKNNEYFIAISNHKDLRQGTRLFDIHIDILRIFLNNLEKIRCELMTEVLHDLPNLHGINVQQILSIVPNEILEGTIEKQRDEVGNLVIKRFNETSEMLINVMRNNKIISSRFKLIRILNGEELSIKWRREKIHPIIQSLLYLYYPVFNDIGVNITNSICQDEITFDYELLVGGLLPIFHNLEKYAKPSSSIKISYYREVDLFKIRFETTSINVLPHEEHQIFDRGFSGEYAKAAKISGKGLGMYQSRRLLQLTGVNVQFIAGPLVNGCDYAENVIELVFDSKPRDKKYNSSFAPNIFNKETTLKNKTASNLSKFYR